MGSKELAVAVRIVAHDNASARSKATFSAIATSARLASSSIKGLWSHITSLKSAMVGLGAGYLALEAARKVNEWGESTAELSRFTRQIGYNIEDFQTFREAAETAGVGPEVFGKSIRFATAQVGELHGGTGKLAAALKDLPGLRKAIASAPNADAAIQIEIEALRRLTNETDKNYWARVFFGRGGADMVRVSQMTKEAFDAERKAAAANGLVTAKAGLDAEQYVIAVDDAGDSLRGLANVLGGQLLPALEPTVKEFAKWVRDNRTEIVGRMKPAIQGIADGFKYMAMEGLPKVIQLSRDIVTHWDQIKGTVVALGYYWASAKFVGGLTTFVKFAAAIEASFVAAKAASIAAAGASVAGGAGGAAAGAGGAAAAGAGGTLIPRVLRVMVGRGGLYGALAATIAGGAYLAHQNESAQERIDAGNADYRKKETRFVMRRYMDLLPLEDRHPIQAKWMGYANGQYLDTASESNNPSMLKEFQDLAHRKYGTSTWGQLADLLAPSPETTNGLDFASMLGQANSSRPDVPPLVEVQVSLKGAGRGTKMTTKSKGRVAARGVVYRGVGNDAYDDEGGE